MLRKLLAVLIALLTMSVVWAPAASAYQPREGGTFNVPRPWGSDKAKYRIVRHVEKAIRKTRPTASDPNPIILISTYLLDRSQSVDALVGACRRGVSVRVIMDEDINNRNSKRIIKVLNGDNPRANGNIKTGPCGRDKRAPGKQELTDAQAMESLREPDAASASWGGDRSYAKKCAGACRGAGGNMHSKFYGFSKSGKANNVVMVSSSNLNKGGALLGWNDLYTMRNRVKSFDEYRVIHREMTDDKKANDQLRQIKDGPYTSRFFPMRSTGKSSDPTLKDLNRIRCQSAYGRTQVHVSMFYWAKSRGEYLASKLLNLARSGCRVNIIYGAPSVKIATRLRDAARRNLINLYDSRWDHNNDGYNEVRTHTKYVLVKGAFGGDRSSHQVLTGTQNWVNGSLSRGDENSLNIALRSAYVDYIRNWADIRRHSRRLPYNR
ncbi:MAG TPA: phospholipase D-like domain-containing protein [Nocardioidaceae bacterium]|nr:phospholipase D-like domain-containing protein [Nocardioidaceae bacterium]